MAVAAAPEYLGGDYANASPALRFGMFLPIWTKQWRKDDDGARASWRKVAKLNPSDSERGKALAARRAALFRTLLPEASLRLMAFSIAPFATGFGNEHPLENGFAFLNPYGLPYLPGSGVKGVVRRAAQELAEDQAGSWRSAEEFEVKVEKRRLSISMTDALFGREPPPGDKKHLQGALGFWDVIPQINGGSLAVEVMTPHYSHYYNSSGNGGGESPHDSGQPNPISFLTVPPDSSFSFYVVCDIQRLKRLAPELAQGGLWKELLKAAFAHAFEWLGFGAKTAVGYGHLRQDQEAETKQAKQEQATREAVRKQQKMEEELRGLSEDEAWVVKRLNMGRWSNTNHFLDDLEKFLSDRQILGGSAYSRLAEQMEKKWKRIMDNPDATKGKKQKPAFSDRQREIAKKLKVLKP